MKSLDKNFNLTSLLAFTFPTICLMVFMSLYGIVDGLFVSNFIGENAFASIGITFPFISFIIAIGTMCSTGGSAIISKNLGEGKQQQGNENLSLITLFSLIISIPFVIAGVFFTEEIASLLGATDALLGYATQYLSILSLFIPFSVLQLLSQLFFVMAGKPTLGLLLGVAGGVTNIVLDYVFIVIFGWGMAGAAIATGLGYCVPAIAYLIYFSIKRKEGLCFAKPIMRKNILLSTCVNGSSEMVTNLSGTITAFLFNIIILKFAAEQGVAAVSVVMYVQFIFMAIFLGYSMGIAPLIGYNHGGKNYNRLHKIVKLSIYIILVFSVLSLLLSLIGGDFVISLFVANDSETFAIAQNGLKLFSICLLFMGINIFASGLFTAFSNGKVSAIISFIRTFILILLFIIVLPQIIGINGVWLAIPCAEFISLFISIYYLRKYRKVYHY